MRETAIIRDSIHPGAKLFMDDGTASSLEEAVSRLKGFRVAIEIEGLEQSDPNFQNCLLTLVNAGARTFLGGIFIRGLETATLATTRLSEEFRLVDEIKRLGGTLVDNLPAGAPLVLLGANHLSAGDFSIRPIWKGWCAGVVPTDERPPFLHAECLSVAPIAAAGLALTECFEFCRGANPMAGQRSVGLNLYAPGESWREGRKMTQTMLLPQSLWVLGVGHLGQAYIWGLASLPYKNGEEARLTLQDFDRLTERNMGTSLLCLKDSIGKMKTRVVAAWAERCGFQATIVERGFEADFKVNSDDPRLMLCGVDNAPTRRKLEEVGFELVLEAGLGAGSRDFTKFRCHAFDGNGRAKQVFKQEQPSTESLVEMPAYKDLMDKLGDACGVVTVAGKAVGVPFVGAVVGSLVVAEAVKAASGLTPTFVSYGNVAEANEVRHVAFEVERRFTVGFVHPSVSLT